MILLAGGFFPLQTPFTFLSLQLQYHYKVFSTIIKYFINLFVVIGRIINLLFHVTYVYGGGVYTALP